MTLRNEILMAYSIGHPERPYQFAMRVDLFWNIKVPLLGLETYAKAEMTD